MCVCGGRSTGTARGEGRWEPQTGGRSVGLLGVGGALVSILPSISQTLESGAEFSWLGQS